MKRCFTIVLPLIATILLLPLGNALKAQSQLFDQKKARQEMEIMEGILQTTLEFGLKEFRLPDQAGKSYELVVKGFRYDMGRVSNITAFYLYGQGAVFVIPVAGLQTPDSFVDVFDSSLKAYPGLNPPGSPQPLEPLAPQSPAPAPRVAAPGADKPATKPVEGNQEELQKRLKAAQENVKKRKEVETILRSKRDELLGKTKSLLIEALANYGDSLTQVKPNEYITIVFTGETHGYFKLMRPGDETHEQEIISVQKSAITDHKAGRLPLESFKQKVLNYKN